jgi:hypothetical protein
MNKQNIGFILSALGILLALHITATAALCFLLGALLAGYLARPDP